MSQSKNKSNAELKRNASDLDSESDDDSGDEVVSNKFANDGSFMEMFKRMQEQQQNPQGVSAPKTTTTTKHIAPTSENIANSSSSNNADTSKSTEVCCDCYFFRI